MLPFPPTHVIFDCEGVLVDALGPVTACLAEALEAEGLMLPHDEVRRRFVGRSMGVLVTAVEAELGRPLPEGWASRLRDETYLRVKFRSRPMPYVAEMLAKLKPRVASVTVVSPTGLDRMTVALGLRGLLRFVAPRLYSAEMFDLDVHAPELFAFASRTSGTARNRTVAVMDTVAGVEAAAEIGVPSLGFVADPLADAEGMRAAGATLFKDMRKLPELLRLA